ncbi:MAG: hypothetical protein HY887_05220 [Deltaproteobacteria bacterium]|nr:hypothetical protein [Deltaproteobacteria bacterium]
MAYKTQAITTGALLVIFFAFCSASYAEFGPIFGPVHIEKTKKDKDEHGKEAKFIFTAPVPGNGVIVIKNGGDKGSHYRTASAKIELNDEKVASSRDFKKGNAVMSYDVTLLADNELDVKVRSCEECFIEVAVLGEKGGEVIPPPAPPIAPPGTPSMPPMPM